MTRPKGRSSVAVRTLAEGRMTRRLAKWLWRWRLVHGYYMLPDEVDLYQLDRHDRDPLNFVGYRFFSKIMRPSLNDPEARALTEDKWIFYQLAKAHGLPIPRTLALYDRKYGVTADGDLCTTVEHVQALLERERPTSLVIKPAGGVQGKGVLIFDEINYGTGSGVLRTGVRTNVWDLLRDLPETQRRTGHGYVVQEAVNEHRAFSRISPGLANTLRVVTHMTRAGEVLVPFASIRLGRDRTMAGNWDQGAVAVGVEMGTGKMLNGVLKPKHGGKWVTSHPDTGAEFVGSVVPKWDEVLLLCQRAARLFPGMRSIGWDVMVSREGPVLLEANEEWDLTFSQLHSEGWLAQPGILADLADSGILPPDHIPSILETLAQIAMRKVVKVARRIAS